MIELKSKKFKFEPFQKNFINSTKRLPCFKAAWGTGKTTCAIVKGLILSDAYKNNLGLIVRKKYTDLRDSTLKDFERYTGLHVPQSTKEVLVGDGSKIMFRHGDELSGLQNVNLGWAYIEQAEEFETEDIFMMLRGRLRRDLELADHWKDKVSVDYPEMVEYIKHNQLRQIMCIANAAGHNWLYQKWVKGFTSLLRDDNETKNEDYDLHVGTTFDNWHNLPEDFIKDLKTMELESPKKYNRYVMNSDEDYDLEGAFYAAKMSDALKDNRVGLTTLFEPGAKVYTFWDLGLRESDTTAIWLVQFIRNEIHLVDYYENHSEGMDHYAGWLEQQGYSYGADFLPHDGKQRLQGRKVETRLGILRELRRNPVHIIEIHRRMERIELARKYIPRCSFNAKCERGVDCLNHYKRKKNDILSTEAKPVFSPEPLHDWSSNGADAFGYMAYAYRYMDIDGTTHGDTATESVDNGHNREHLVEAYDNYSWY
jgi:hypothetical protein